jgi:hypothetical protein
LNPFGGSGANSLALLTSLLEPPSESRYRTEAIQSVASVQGPLAALPAGALEFIAGAEWREERVRYNQGPPQGIAGSNQRSIVAVFGELRLPLVGEATRIPAVHDLVLVLSGRSDDYSDVGRVFNPEYALIWRPTSALTLRTSLPKAFAHHRSSICTCRTLSRQYLSRTRLETTNLLLPILRAGGNPELEAFQCRFRSTSACGSSRDTDLLFASEQTIGESPSTTRLPFRLCAIAVAENLFPERILRGPPSASDIAAGRVGPLELIDITRMNFGTFGRVA